MFAIRRAVRPFSRVLVFAVVALLLVAFPLLGRQAAPQPSPAAQASPANRTLNFHEDEIAKITAGSDAKELVAAAEHVAWSEKAGNSWSVRLDGKPSGPKFERIENMHFNADGTHLAFFGKRNNKWIFVVDGQESPGSYTYHTTAAYQPEGKSIAFGACLEKKRCRLILDGTPTGTEYEDISYARYSEDGKRLAYFAKKKGNKWVAVVDGKETGPDLVGVAFTSWGFSSHANRFYAAVLPPRLNWTYMVDDSVGPSYETISPIAFTDDDRHYVFAGVNAHGGFKKQKVAGVVVYDGTANPELLYEGNGMQGAWTAILNYSQVMLAGPRTLNANFHGLSSPAFNSRGKLIYAARNGKGDIVVLDGDKSGPSFDDVVSGIVFTPGEEHIAYVARRGSDFVEVRDDQAGKTYPLDAKIGAVEWIWLSKDGAHLAYELVRGGGIFSNGGTTRARRSVVVDGQIGAEYNSFDISLIRFNKDRSHCFYQVIGADGNRTAIIADGVEGKLYDDQTFAHFSSDDKSLFYFARDGARIIRVSASLP